MSKQLLITLFYITSTFFTEASPNEGRNNQNRVRHDLTFKQELVGKRVKYADAITQEKVERFLKPTRMKNNGKVVPNPHYNLAFTKLVSRLKHSSLRFQFRYNPMTESGKGGHLRFDGKQVIIEFGDAGIAYGGNANHILFEETKHAEQVLDGKIYFVDPDRDGNWGIVTSIQVEVDAKLFVIDNLYYSKTYVDPKTQINCPTQLGMLARKRESPKAMRYFLKYGARNLKTVGEFIIDIPPAYPNYSIQTLIYYQRKIESDTVFTFPYKNR